jgi:hypothetical protein
MNAIQVIAGSSLVFCCLGGRLDAQEKEGRQNYATTVGIPARIKQVVLPGPELVVKRPEDAQAPLVLRIAKVFKHGDAHRYDLVYYALEPGEYDLAKSLQRKDGGEAELPPLLVKVSPVLPPDQITPNEPLHRATPSIGGYRRWLVAGGLLWLAGLYAILFVGRRRRRALAAKAAIPLTLPERLRPLFEAARRGALTDGQKAELERLLVATWRERLGLENLDASSAMNELRRHPQAGPMLERLEALLHQPDGAKNAHTTDSIRELEELLTVA